MKRKIDNTMGVSFQCLKYFSLAVMLLFAFSLPAFAVDGVIEINQAKAVAGSVTPGDSPGFPVTISASGSYRLTGNLTVSATTADAIEIGANDVTVDLNGFTISGPGNGTGRGIDFHTSAGVTVIDGDIQNIGSDGIGSDNSAWYSYAKNMHIKNIRALGNGGKGIQVGDTSMVSGSIVQGNADFGILAGDNCTVIGNIAKSNGKDGISVRTGCTVIHNTSSDNGGAGIVASYGSTVTNNSAIRNTGWGIKADASTVSENTANDNGYDGIYSSGGMVTDNLVKGNTKHGLNLPANAGYAQNTVLDNTGGTVFGGIQMGTNVCGTYASASTTCP